MYEKFFGLKENPFSIAPDPRYLYMSERHRDALAHLLFGIEREGGVVVLTGEVGTGKTTLCRYFLQRLPDNVEMAFILHPKLTARELLSAICSEFGIIVPLSANTKVLVDAIHNFLLDKHAQGIHLALLIDEAQNLSADVLEELRLLTNLETDQKKLLQIILLGQPELRDLLANDNLRQLAQRVTARYHLGALQPIDVRGYLAYRLSVAGCSRELFNESAIKRIAKLSQGIPRLINLIADRALLGAYSENEHQVTVATVNSAAKEVGFLAFRRSKSRFDPWTVKVMLSGALAGFLALVLIIKVLDHREANRQKISDPAVPVMESDAVLANSSRPTESGDESVEESPAGDNLSAAATDDELVQPPVTPSDEVAEPTTIVADEPGASAAKGTSVSEGMSKDLVDQVADDDATLQKPSPFARFLAGRDNTYEAYLALMRAWGIVETPAKHVLACEYAERYGLRCLHRKGNWRSLISLDRPVVMRLLNDQGKPFQATLLSLEKSGRAQVILDGKSVVTHLKELDSRWEGDYSLFYKLPPYQSRLIAPGKVQDADAWMTDQMDEISARWLTVAGTQEGPPPPPNTAPLINRVKWFQAIAGLEQDGVAGTMTLISLNSWLDPTIPRLSRSTAAGGR